MTGMTVDVIIPCWGSYNRSLERCVRSASDADCVIVVGDDEACNLAGRLGLTCIPIEAPPHIGAARQAGLAVARSDAVCFLDADDVMTPNALFKLRALLEERNEPVAITARLQKTTGGFWPPTTLARLVCSPFGGPLLLFRNSISVVGACLIRRSAASDLLLFPELADEDWHAAIALRNIGKVEYYNFVAIEYDTTAGSLSRSVRSEAELRRSHSQLFKTALDHGAAPRWFWRLMEFAAGPYRSRHERRMSQSWAQTEPR